MNTNVNYNALTTEIKRWALALGFDAVGVSDIDLEEAETRLNDWLARQYHGEMHYMEKHGTKRTRPAELVPGTLRVINVRLDYQPESRESMWNALEDPDSGYISRYALGRDYHKVMRGKLKHLAWRIEQEIGELGYRVFCDSAPVMEKPLAEKAGLGWIGKHTNLLDRHDGSWFFLGTLYVDIPLDVDAPVTNHCGSCTACIDVCPTQAIVAPYQVDARRCLSYHTIELHGPIPVEFRKAMGNRIYGCDDCQLVCPWNRYAKLAATPDFAIRHPLHNENLVTLFGWDETTFLRETEGSAIRRIGHERWLRNVAVALGNASTSDGVVLALRAREKHPSALVREHVEWALQQHLGDNHATAEH